METFVPVAPAWVSHWVIASPEALTTESVVVKRKNGSESTETVSLEHHWVDGSVHYYLLAKTAEKIATQRTVAIPVAENTTES